MGPLGEYASGEITPPNLRFAPRGWVKRVWGVISPKASKEGSPRGNLRFLFGVWGFWGGVFKKGV